MTITERFAHHDSKGRRVLKPSGLFLCLFAFLFAAAANAVPLTYTLSGVTFSDTGTASGTFAYDAVTHTYSSINITTVGASRAGAVYNSVSGGFVPDNTGVLLVTMPGASQSGLPGLALFFSPILTGSGGTSTLTGEESDCSDPECSVPSGVMRTITAGTVTATNVAVGALNWFLSGVRFADGATASGSFTFDAGSFLFSNVNITTTNATRTGATYTTVSGGLLADATGVLTVTSPALDQTGLPGFSLFFSPALTGAGGSVPVTGQEADCVDAGCTMPSGTMRLLTAGSVVTSLPTTLTITKSHSGNFLQGQTAVQYIIQVGNIAGGVATNAPVMMTETPPSGMVVTAMSGSGWTCTTSSCTRSDTLAGGFNYPAITATVNIAPNAPALLTNQATVSGGGSPTANASDPTTIFPTPVLAIAKSHTGDFMLSQIGAQYSILVGNAGGVPTTGFVTVTENPPTGLTVTAMSGTGWTCNTVSCTRPDALPSGSSYPAITVTANVSANAPASLTNSATVAGGGSVAAVATNLTNIGAPICAIFPSTTVPGGSLSVSPAALNFGIAGSVISGQQPVTVDFPGGAGVAWTATPSASNILVSPSSGTGSAIIQISVTGGTSGSVTVAASAPNSPQVIQVAIANVAAGTPFGSFDTPANNTSGIAGAVAIGGWALDNVEVTLVDIWREKVGAETVQSNGLVFVGTAGFVPNARPDVQVANPGKPFNYRAGWGYLMLTNSLPNNGGAPGQGNGTYKLHVIAHNRAGVATDLGTRTITVDNADAARPFGTIDTPNQSDTISGNAYENFGWALTQTGYMIPTDGSTITVMVDGVNLGHPTYNQFRSDISTLFPGLANSNGPVGYFCIDTTSIPNGMHTISWLVYDNASRGDGIGSRFFTVLNHLIIASAAPEVPIETPATVTLRRGPDGPSETLASDSQGRYHTAVAEAGRVELHLGARLGYLLVNGRRSPLPIGSALIGGVFTWQLAAGYLGAYDLVFERPDHSEVQLRVTVGSLQ